MSETHPQAGRVSWHVVVPLKEARQAKSRLMPPPSVSRIDLARAMAADTLTALCSALPARRVTVVTSDPGSRTLAGVLGARVEPDPGTGLNAAIRAGLRSATTAARYTAAGAVPDAHPVGLAVLLGDLPCLRAEDVTAGLIACQWHPSAMVPDADGTGTVLLTGLGTPPSPRFGTGSAEAHSTSLDAHGRRAQIVGLHLSRLRRDVDDALSLEAAVRLGVGRYTDEVLRSAASAHPPSAP